ncbi:lipoyl protein ligase domain-containing protein [Simkania sp.]|uniref:lipoyl protein ligase domain-containing protein n=1 Tax=Simkania sp. TaxID=34094 RepID=UPI003B52A1FB
MSKETLHLLRLQNHDIHEQLLLEEALLRTTDQNWCVLNHGSPPRIVMGISGKPQKLIDSNKMTSAPIPLIKRYSGGGTVIVDSDTLFVSFIFQKEIHSFPCYPEPILRWSEEFYQEALSIPDFHLRENDYVIGEKKCGGNAQYIKKNRFVHHTTFLWDFKQSHMDYLLHPEKTPKYRDGRSHESFLCRLNDFLPSEKSFFDGIQKALKNRYFVQETPLNTVVPLLNGEHRITTCQIIT